ncbi:serine protease gd-like isoform X1 [Diabrotica virgifera virgifera]|uniref:Peptidase S1 domain-containing protein n=1 Tax=Diabrotica virgifera virgifera TaxID=50390 RepID=A0ABM5JX26_DIAVI|nr:serine protease gd-like isoform X1 [Diabrotica virgifera virgifera]
MGVELTLVLLLFGSVVSQDLVSPCPNWFKYEARKPDEPDRIYGVLTLMSESDLGGIWMRVNFDRPSLQLGNWFGIVKTDDNTMYKIQAPNKKLLANVPTKVRFYIKYDTSQPPPKLVEIRLNAKTVCPEKGATTEAPASTDMYFTSPELNIPSTQRPFERPTRPSRPSRPTVPINPPVSSIDNFYENNNGRPSNSDDDDFFMGDFAWLGKPRPNRPQYLEEECGVVIKPAQPLITYGEPTGEGEFPWHAALYHARGIDLTYICGATLITRYHLITVAHCVTRLKTQNALSPSSLMVYLGKYYLKVWSNAGIQDRQIEKIIVHQNYNSRTFNHDIAILKLIEPAEITNYVRPACLWEDNTSLESVIGRQGTVVGWGFDETGRVTEQLTKAHMPVVSQETCIYSFPEFYSRFTSDHTYCAGFNNGKTPVNETYAINRGAAYSTYVNFLIKYFRYQYSQGDWKNQPAGTSVCNGDSGGGMVFPRSGSSPNNPIWEIRGMVSISVALQNQFRCDSSHYVVFTDIAKYLDWIKNALTL